MERTTPGREMDQPENKTRRGTSRSPDRSSAHATMEDCDYEALAQFRLQIRTFLAFSEAAARKAGLTPQQHQALLAIRGFAGAEAASIGDVARLLLIRHHTAVELMNRMVKLDLVERTADPLDARRVRVRLTAEGEQKLQALSQIHLEELQTASLALTRILGTIRSKVR